MNFTEKNKLIGLDTAFVFNSGIYFPAFNTVSNETAIKTANFTPYLAIRCFGFSFVAWFLIFLFFQSFLFAPKLLSAFSSWSSPLVWLATRTWISGMVWLFLIEGTVTYIVCVSSTVLRNP